MTAISQTALLVVFLAHQAWLMADAIGRTLFRLFVSRRRLLEWMTAAQSKQMLRTDWMGFYRQMAGGVVIAALAAASSGVPATPRCRLRRRSSLPGRSRPRSPAG